MRPTSASVAYDNLDKIMTSNVKKDLTDSPIHRQNILNNPFAVQKIEQELGLTTILFEGERVVAKETLAHFFEIDVRTVERCVEAHKAELEQNGYQVLRGRALEAFKAVAQESDVAVGAKTSVFSVFPLRAFLNVGMLLRDCARAQRLRQMILDVVIDVVNVRTGGGTKYINRRDEDFLPVLFRGESYRKEFTDALRDYVVEGKFKYPIYTDKIYAIIFKEKAREYRKILKLESGDNVRNTFYVEVLRVVATYEREAARRLKKLYEAKERRLTLREADGMF